MSPAPLVYMSLFAQIYVTNAPAKSSPSHAAGKEVLNFLSLLFLFCISCCLHAPPVAEGLVGGVPDPDFRAALLQLKVQVLTLAARPHVRRSQEHKGPGLLASSW